MSEYPDGAAAYIVLHADCPPNHERCLVEVTHRCPPKGSDIMPCCGESPFMASKWDRMTVFDEFVTCNKETP